MFVKKVTTEMGRHAEETCVILIPVKTVAPVYQLIPPTTASVCLDGLDRIVKLGNTAYPILVRMEEHVFQKITDTDVPASVIMKATIANWQIHAPQIPVKMAAHAKR